MLEEAEELLTVEATMALMQDEIYRLKSPAYAHAVVLDVSNKIDPSKFEPNDLVYVINEGLTGRIAPTSPVVDALGNVTILFPDLTQGKYQIGLNGERPELKLVGKNDGTHVTIIYDNNQYEVSGIFGVKFEPGQTVKINTCTKQIISGECGVDGPGEVGLVKKIIDENYTEVEFHGQSRVVFNGKVKDKIVLHDRVQIDSAGYVLLRTLGRDNADGYTVDSDELNVTWDDIGGCEDAKLALRQVLEYPTLYPELYKFYKRKSPKGILLHGPSGCGKTILVKASALSVAKAHGKKATKTGLTMIKGPEILSKWVGASEERIRALFQRGRDHFKENGYPPLLVIDEAESLMMTRGSGRSSDVEKTIVPQFLAEMDGIDPYPGIVVLLTNRPDMIDPAITRAGRIDRHIKVPRPDLATAKEIFRIHLNGTPLHNTTANEVADTVVSEAYDPSKRLYQIRSHHLTKPLYFTLANCLNGAMFSSIVGMAVDIAVERDRQSGKAPKGVAKNDFVSAVNQQYKEQVGQNHQFDLEDFFVEHQLQACELKIEKLRV